MDNLVTQIEKYRALVEDFSYPTVREWKGANPKGQVIGVFPVYTPVEIIHAAGMLPVGVLGGCGQIDIDRADSRIQSFVCSISRSTLELGLGDYLKSFDGVYFTSICDVARNLSGIWKSNFPNMLTEYIHFPQNVTSPHAVTYYANDLNQLKSHLEKMSGKTMSAENLFHSIGLYNQNRKWIRTLYQIKREAPERISAYETYVLLRMGMILPVEEHNRLMENAIQLIQSRSRKVRDNIRVILEGSFCEQPPFELIQVLEESGCYLVDDDLLIQTRWFEKDVPLTGNPIDNLAEAYLKMSIPSSVRHYGDSPRWETFLQKCKVSNIDGVIFCAPKFCEPALLDYVLMKDTLDKNGIGHLAFEYEEKMSVFESIRSQVETFVESILLYDEKAGSKGLGTPGPGKKVQYA